ncbi:glycosyl transferase family 2 [candidate division WOR-1 bacterium RIFCSPLOWO2_02_FULL_46_20]|uniref:Glycosyl transferase family 2 n=1 Tax=candidate division WOR-1 bacterium RIFCSPLOWO2_02_FULL_46_20 TaxID=1802567 RepID=A0A1F4R6M4_UNCSA|nr:MAG: glycosyl transferase family 2 [candidate division WOR-1 bacterium RIFCSPLOWO2_02_FULL_46_20]
MNQNKKLISLIIPVFNEEENIFLLYQAVMPIINACTDRYDFELVFTDNHSIDSTYEKLSELRELDQRVRVFRFSRNFGYQKSILTGYLKARGDALIQLDCDLQDPPELIPEFIKHWENGCAVVYGVRRSRKESAILHFSRRLFYRLADYLSEDDLPVDVGDFRLIDKKVVDVLRQVDDAQPYLRGMIAAMGFKQHGIEYDRHERERGQSNFRFKDLVGLALDGILNHSIVPLRIATFFGISVTVLTLIAIAGYIAGKLLLGINWPAGFTTLTVLILAGISVNALFLGIIGEYLGRIYQQVKKRPLVIVESTLDDHIGNGSGTANDTNRK